ncbi:hypothetical protein [Leuconostoc mesenteroides]|uniref:hypothetical protein n=1 Tax=Leuconostoc mesenteroides TaxID=1245 RepID=UPI0010ADE1E0|nr:hypothetical protein [Leuconostoc mesenteroides]TJY27366.1 hypothetical protein FCF26_09465 [Leuconostoc mesenteroides subsp. mesenteroides]
MTRILRTTITILMVIITLLALLGIVYVTVRQQDHLLFRIVSIVINWCMGLVVFGWSMEKL